MKTPERQSKTFLEVWNVQTDMNVTEDKWDQIFHNWEHPENCSGRKRPAGCSICARLEKGEVVIRKSDGKHFGTIPEGDS